MFRLKTYLSIVIFIAIVAFAVAINVYYRYSTIQQLVELEERHSFALTRTIANTLWPKYHEFLKKAESLQKPKLEKHPLSKDLHSNVAEMVHGLPVIKIKIFDIYGKTLFSTNSAEIGIVKPANYPGSQVALTGNVISKISRREKFRIINGSDLYDREVLSSYVPIRVDPDNHVVGVLEIYTDITETLAEIERKQLDVIGVVLVILGLLYAVLYAFIAHADRILTRQRNEHRQATELSSRLGRLLDRSANEIYIFDAESFRFTHVNQGARYNLGYSAEEMSEMAPWELKPEYTRNEFLAYIEPLCKGDLEQMNFETIHERKDGSTYPVEVRLQFSSAEQPPVYVAMILDITERMRAEGELRKLSRAIEQSPNTVVITDTESKIEYVNPKFVELTGYTAAEVLGQNLNFWRPDDTADDTYDELWRTIKDGKEWRGEIENRRKDGSIYWAAESMSALRNKNGEVTHYICMQQDITGQKDAEDRLNYLAYYDNLTGLPNRRLFADRLQQAMKESDRNERLVAVLFIDLDQFKNINDSLGHETGDILLQEAAERLRFCVRASDTVSRWGGDEFSLVLRDMENVDNAIVVAKKIIESFSKPFHIKKQSLFVTASIGVVLYPLDDNNVDGLLKNADAAMYYAKDAGRNNFQFYSNEMTVRVEERLKLENDLRQALARNEFILFYQPQIDSYNGTVVGMEALIRWQHPQKGLIAPDRFISVAEETGLIVPIGEWVLREACKQNQVLEGLGLPPIRVAVNLSARQLLELNLVDTVNQALKDTGLDPALLELEITESMLMSDIDRVTGMLEELSALGVTISIDDFGTGYSSLAYLKSFPISALKIDRSFVRDIPEDEDNMSITTAIINMANGLGIHTVAEGVETKEQFDFLKLQKCNYIQGYYFSKPVPSNEIIELLQLEQANTRSSTVPPII